MKQPLTLYVLWHPEFEDGKKYANAIYSTFSRDVKEPLARGVGIPAYFRTNVYEQNRPLPIDVEKSGRTAVIALIDDKVVIDEEWTSYLNDLGKKIKTPHILYPVAVTPNAFNMEGGIPEINFIRLYKYEESRKTINLLINLAQELCRLLYNRDRLAEAGGELSPAPIKIFLSHAKKDGEELVKKLNSYIQDKLSADTFFDTTDIAKGFKFPSEIDENIKQSVLLALLTDFYSSSEWCRKEVTKAKRHNCPVVVVNALKEGEKRSFPYMANVPNIHWNLDSGEPMETVFEKLFFQVLMESLRFMYQRENIKYLLSIFEVAVEDRNILENPPELLTFLKIKSRDKTMAIYPDPPLGDMELELLEEFEPKVQFVTPMALPLITSADKKFLSGVRVGVSVSEYPDSSKYGFEQLHFQDMFVELSRYLLMCGAGIAYGGNIKYDKDLNFATLLFDLAVTYSAEQKETPEKIRNYVPYPIYETISDTEKANLIKTTRFIEIKPPEDLEITESIETILENETAHSQYVWARCLTRMREEIAKNTDVQIFLGGKTTNFKGKYPGLLEEACLALKEKKPVYLIGAFGGCTRNIIEAIENKRSEEFTDYPRLLDFLDEKTVDDLNNGLTPEENRELFQSDSIPEVIYLVLQGLKRRFLP